MNHPSSCKDPACTLSYRDHLISISISADAIPSRRSGAHKSNITDKRWQRDHAAFRRLVKQGYHPPQIDGSRLRELKGESEHDINIRQVNIDYSDPR